MSQKKLFYSLQLYVITIVMFLIGGLLLIYYNNNYMVAYWAVGIVAIFCTPKRWISSWRDFVVPAWWEGSYTQTIKKIKMVCFFTVAFTIVVHGFLFANEFFSHDSLMTLYNQYDILPFYSGVGRFLIPIYETIKGEVVSPWIVGVLFFCWMALANLLTIKLFDVNSLGRQVIVCGLMCSNVTLSLTGATYIYCMDEYAMALFFAVAAAYLFQKCPHGGFLGVLCLVLSMALYQSYFTITLVFCYLFAILNILKGRPLWDVIKQGVKSLVLMIGSFILYFMTWTMVCKLLEIEKNRLGETMLTKSMSELWQVICTAISTYTTYLTTESGYLFGVLFPLLNILLIIILCINVIMWVRNKTIPIQSKVLLISLIIIAPFVFNSSSILLAGNASYLTHYARMLIYLLVLIVVEQNIDHSLLECIRLRRIAGVLLCLVIWQNTVFANQIYMKKDFEKVSTALIVSRLIERVEQVEGYVPGETPVTFVGHLSENAYLNRGRAGYENVKFLPGLGSDNAVTYTGTLYSYLGVYLNYPISLIDGEVFSEDEQVKNMPVFPQIGSVEMIDQTVVVKLS